MIRSGWKSRTKAQLAKWNADHARERRKWASLVAAGGLRCPYCHRLIDPAAVWHLAHRDDGPGYLGPAHRKCNEDAGRAKANETRRRRSAARKRRLLARRQSEVWW